MPETAEDVAGAGRQAAPAAMRTVELHHPRRPAAVAIVPARNGLPESKPYVYGGLGYDQFPELRDDGQ